MGIIDLRLLFVQVSSGNGVFVVSINKLCDIYAAYNNKVSMHDTGMTAIFFASYFAFRFLGRANLPSLYGIALAKHFRNGAEWW